MQEYTVRRNTPGKRSSNRDLNPMRPMESVANFQYGLSCSLNETGEYPILRMMNYDEELVAATDLKYADMSEAMAAEFTVREGDLLFNRTNSAELVGKIGIFKLRGVYLFASYLVRVSTNRDELLPEFLNYFLNSPKGRAAVRAFATPGVSQANISAGSLKKVLVPVPSLREQEAAVAELDRISSAHRTARSHLVSQGALFLSLVNTVVT
jgi:hypothetical protein